MKLEKHILLGLGAVIAILASLQFWVYSHSENSTQNREPSSLVGGVQALPPQDYMNMSAAQLPGYDMNRFAGAHSSAIYNEQQMRMNYEANQLRMQNLINERQRAQQNNRAMMMFPNNSYDNEIRRLQFEQSNLRLQRSYSLQNSFIQMQFAYLSQRHMLTPEQDALAQQQLQQLISLQYQNNSGAGYLYQMPTTSNPQLQAQPYLENNFAAQNNTNNFAVFSVPQANPTTNTPAPTPSAPTSAEEITALEPAAAAVR